MKDNVTGEDLIRRSDDSVDTFRRRLKTYEEQTGPVIDYYKKQNLVTQVDASQEPSLVWSAIDTAFKLAKN